MFFRPISETVFSRPGIVQMAAKCIACNDLHSTKLGGRMAVRVQLAEL
jgi:hypothetical protein